MSWYGTGFAGVKESFDQRQEYLKNKPEYIKRFFVKQGVNTNIIFLDEAAFTYDEHKIYPEDKNWKNVKIETCAGAHGNCVWCKSGLRPQRMTAFSVVDRTKYVNREGKEVKDEKKMLVLNAEIALSFHNKIRKLRDEDPGFSLVGSEFTVGRIGSQSPACGNDFEVVREAPKPGEPVRIARRDLEKAKTKGIDVTPIDYVKVLAPKSQADMRASAPVSVATGDFDDPVVHSAGSDEDVPF